MENEKKYLHLVDYVLKNGVARNQERTGAGTKAVFGVNLNLNLKDGFPLLTYRKIFYKGVIGELVSFLRGHTNANDFKSLGCNYWDAWAAEDGNLGPIYGYQWRNFNSQNIDQLKNVIEEAKINPQSRRLYVSAWNPAQADKMALLPCFHGFQLFIHKTELSLLVNMRSSDIMLGLPSDILFHALLMLVISNNLNLTPTKLTFNLADAHIYSNHINEAVKVPRAEIFKPATVNINPRSNIDNIYPEDFNISGYKHGASIKFPINV